MAHGHYNIRNKRENQVGSADEVLFTREFSSISTKAKKAEMSQKQTINTCQEIILMVTAKKY